MANERVRALPRKPDDEFTDVVIRVPDRTMFEAWKDLEEPLKESPDYASMRGEGADPEWTFDERELRLLVGAFGATTTFLPMGPHGYVRWVDRWDESLSNRQYISEFVADRIVADDRALWQIGDRDLDALPARVLSVKGERARSAAITADDLPEAFEKSAIGDVILAIYERFDEAEMAEIAEHLQTTLTDNGWGKQVADN